jgi:hypothetical protein
VRCHPDNSKKRWAPNPPACRHPDNSKKIRLARHGQRGFARGCCAMPLSLRDAAQPQVLVVRRYARVMSDHIELTSTAS